MVLGWRCVIGPSVTMVKGSNRPNSVMQCDIFVLFQEVFYHTRDEEEEVGCAEGVLCLMT